MSSATGLWCYMVLWLSAWKMGIMILRVLALTGSIRMGVAERTVGGTGHQPADHEPACPQVARKANGTFLYQQVWPAGLGQDCPTGEATPQIFCSGLGP